MTTKSPTRALRSATARRPEEPSEEAGGFSRVLVKLPLSLVCTVLAGAGLLTGATAAALATSDPTALAHPLSGGVLALAAFVGGLISGFRCRGQELAAGLLTGGMLVLILTLLSPVAGAAEGAPPVAVWLTRLGALALSVLGAYLTRKRPEKKAHNAPSSRHPARR